MTRSTYEMNKTLAMRDVALMGYPPDVLRYSKWRDEFYIDLCDLECHQQNKITENAKQCEIAKRRIRRQPFF